MSISRFNLGVNLNLFDPAIELLFGVPFFDVEPYLVLLLSLARGVLVLSIKTMLGFNLSCSVNVDSFGLSKEDKLVDVDILTYGLLECLLRSCLDYYWWGLFYCHRDVKRFERLTFSCALELCIVCGCWGLGWRC